VHQRKWDGLQPQRFSSKFAGVPKQDPAAEKELPADQPSNANRPSGPGLP
jgi:hypothetical protein